MRYKLATVTFLVYVVLSFLVSSTAEASINPYGSSSYVDNYATQLAQWRTGLPQVTVQCDAPENMGDSNGYVMFFGYPQPDGTISWWPSSVIHLNGPLCGALDNVNRMTTDPLDRLWAMRNGTLIGTAALALTHESMHIALRSTDEGHVECMAIRNIWPTIERLNLPRKLAKRVYMAAWSYHDALPSNYRTEC